MKRGQFTDREIQTTKKIEEEFERFKYRMLSRSRKKIFKSSRKISFYSCIYEYFMYAEDIEASHMAVCLQCPDVIAHLYRIYMKYEYLRYSRWQDIEELQDVFVREHEEWHERIKCDERKIPLKEAHDR